MEDRDPSAQAKSHHRGSGGDLQIFAPRFIAARMLGFKKDMAICLTGVPRANGGGLTHAYFPALAACCGAIEYLASLSVGQPVPIRRGLSRSHIKEFAHRYMAQPDYDGEAIRILWDLFRNGTAHRGITSGVWLDHHSDAAGRRLTWAIKEHVARPALAVRAKAGTIKRDSPWQCTYTHVATLALGQLAADIEVGADRLAADIAGGGKALDRFRIAMEILDPS